MMMMLLAETEGSVSPTLVIDGRGLNKQPEKIIPILKWIQRTYLIGADVTKFAVIRPSNHPLYDINYLFFQLIVSQNSIRFDYQGSCGHSILASIIVAIKWGWLPWIHGGLKVNTYVENVGDSIACEVTQIDKNTICCTTQFIELPKKRLSELLLTGSVTNKININSSLIEYSLTSLGNPYIFLRAEVLNIYTEEALLDSDIFIFEKLKNIRLSILKSLALDMRSIFPKICLIGRFSKPYIVVKAISIPYWHPTLALTGAACLGAAASIRGTVVNQISSDLIKNENIKIKGKKGSTAVQCYTTGNEMQDFLLYTKVFSKKVKLLGKVSNYRREKINIGF